MRVTRPEPGIRVQLIFTIGTLVALTIMFFIAKAVLGNA